MTIDWHMIDAATAWFTERYSHRLSLAVFRLHYRKWMLEENGIRVEDHAVTVVDDEKYLMARLRWS